MTSANEILRMNSLALTFQEVFTIVLRTRFSVQRWDTADRMRGAMRQQIAAAAQNVRALGYSDESTQMALYAMIGFLDESVLNSKDPVFADWARRPLQEEMFGSQLAGEYFFRHVAELLNRPESSEVADVLELHCLCLLLGYRGRFAYGDASEIDNIIRRIRDKIVRIRGPFAIVRTKPAASVTPPESKDEWVSRLTIARAVLAAVFVIAYLGYFAVLLQSMPPVVHTAFLIHSALEIAS
jgi:type VI secretion system protein ImpK